MIYNLININVNGQDAVVTCSATLQITDDTGNELYTKSFSVKKRADAPTGWYADAKAELLKQAQAAKDKYLSTMGLVLTETGKTNTDEIIADIKAEVEGGLV